MVDRVAAVAKARGVPCLFIVTGQTPQWMLGKSFDTHAPFGPWDSSIRGRC